MRRKSERTVKNSPIKKTEPTNRRTSRRTRKSPEKTIAEEDSENSSDQAASSSENEEEEEVVAPKRSRRTSRTIEKSSSAEEVKATPTTTTRQRRRTTAKKDADIQEEESVEAEPSTTSEEPKGSDESVAPIIDEKNEVVNVDSSTEPVSQADQAPQEVSNNIEPDHSGEHIATNETEHKQGEHEIVEQEAQTATESIKTDNKEPVEISKSRRRTLKRNDKENIPNEIIEKPISNEPSSNENVPNVVNKSPINEIKSSESKIIIDTDSPIEQDLQNGNNQSDVADTTAKDTTASETDSTTKLNKKKPIVRKRKWLTNKTAAPKVQEIAISTDSLKGLISDVKPVPLSDIQLDSSPEVDQESDDVKVVSSTSIDYNRRSEEHVVESTDDGNTINISTSRKISIVNESEGEQPLSPAKHNPCNILYITNLVRPFTVLQLKSLLQRTGKIAEDGFWIDKIKSKCFVKYETEDEAIETRHALHGIRWPTSNPKCLNVDFGTESLMDKAVASTADDGKPSVTSRDDRIVSSNELHDSARERGPAADRPVREWDLGKKDSHRPREVERAEREREREQKPSRETARDGRDGRDGRDIRDIDQRIPMCQIINMKPLNETFIVDLNGTFTDHTSSISEQVCATKLETEMLGQGLILESCYTFGFILIGLLINRVGKFPILFFVLAVSGSGGIMCMLSDIPLVQIASFIGLMCCAIAGNIVNAATVDIYPTSLRAMAVCIALMFGRLGCVVGANTVAHLLENHCEMVFYVSGSSILVISVSTYFIPNIHNRIEPQAHGSI